MTRKDFQLIADVLAGDSFATEGRGQAHRVIVANAFADALATTNPRFDRAKFMAACGANA